ncbi:hypothetical protein, partial [Escherichia coli]|uniref:hypothetical protein n=1 Tax=Escherichia coli TaxID=562 RepID=UPI00398AD8E5
DATVFALVVEASCRGLHTAVGMGLVDWVRVRLPWVPAAEVAQHRQVAEAAATHWGAPLGQALRQGRTGLARAGQVARTLSRL